MPFSNLGDFVPTTNVWDVSQIYDIDPDSPEFKELLVQLYQNINNISLSLNTRASGYFPLQQFTNGELYFPDPTATDSSTPQVYRQVIRTTVNFGTLPNTGTKTVAHNIPIGTNTAYTFTHIYGAASDTTDFTYIPLPYSSATLVDNIELSVNATDVVVTTAADYSAYTISYIVVEYLTQ